MADTSVAEPIPSEGAPAVQTTSKDPLAEPTTSTEAQEEPSEAPAPAANDPKSTLAARMARFKSIKATVSSAKAENSKRTGEEALRVAREKEDPNGTLLQRKKLAGDRAALKLEKDEDPDNFERKRAWDWTVDESERWDKRLKKSSANRDNNAFSDWRAEANKNYKRQVKQMGKVDLDAYLAEKAQKLQSQVTSGLLELVETEDGNVFTVDKAGRINTPVDEAYTHGDHKPSKDAVDRLVSDLDKAERARLKARAARGMNDDEKGDVTYINQKNKQFNDKLARFYNRYTTEIRESFERGTAI